MRLPLQVLSQIRGPLLAAAMVGCASSPAEAPEAPAPEPAPEATVDTAAVAAIDPVGYDADAEAERLDRLDRALAAAETRRDRPVDDEEATRRAERARERANSIGVGNLSHLHLIGCGRG